MNLEALAEICKYTFYSACLNTYQYIEILEIVGNLSQQSLER